MRWHLAPSLEQLRAEINALWPSRDKSSDGSVGDTAHGARKSDHNPAPPTNVVRAIDVDEDGIDPSALLLAAIRDERTEYVIYESLIYRRDRGFRAEYYSGSNKHDKHMHISIRHGARFETSTASWHVASQIHRPAVPAATRTNRRKYGDEMIIYRAGGYPPLGVLAHNGAWATLTSQEEVNNLEKFAKVPIVWVEKRTLDAMILDGRS